MKILILGFAKIKYTPYLNGILDCTSADDNITLFYFDRDESEDTHLDKDITVVRYYKKLSDFDSPVKKLFAFYGYRKKAKKLFAHEKFDYVVSLHTWPAVLLYKEIKQSYKDKFIFDYKDITFEEKKWFARRVGKLIELSKYTLISSKAFLKVLPKSDKYLISHNINTKVKRPAISTVEDKKKTSHPIRVSFWGLMRHKKTDTAFMKALGDDPRFELHFYGRDGEYISEYINEHNSKNIFLHGTYVADELVDIAKNTDLLLNIQDETFQNSLALGNKLYDGAYYYVPQIGDENSYMGQKIIDNGLGICVDVEDSQLNEILYKYINNINSEEFINNCNTFIDNVLNENEQTRSTLCHTISIGKKMEN